MTITCDAIKIAYRQSKTDGFVVSFSLHPSEVPTELVNAPLGSQWQLQLVPLDDDGNPDPSTPQDGRAAASVRDEPGAPPPQESKNVHRALDTLPLPQQASLLCKMPTFWAYVKEKWKIDCTSEEMAKYAMYGRYGIKSRTLLMHSNLAACDKFKADRDSFNAWKTSVFA